MNSVFGDGCLAVKLTEDSTGRDSHGGVPMTTVKYASAEVFVNTPLL